MPKVVQLKDRVTGEVQYPVTCFSAVRDENGNDLFTIPASINLTEMVNHQYFSTLESAINAVPNEFRKPGLIITFAVNESKTSWETWQFSNGSFDNWLLPQCWTNLAGNYYQLVGVATVDTIPGIPFSKCYYLATQRGTYTHFRDNSGESIVINTDEVVLLKWNGSYWIPESTRIAVNV